MSMEHNLSEAHPYRNAVLWRHRLLLSVVMVHLASALVVSLYTGVPFETGTVSRLMMLLTVLVPCFLILLTLWRFAWMAVTQRPEKPIQWFIKDLRSILLDPDRMLGGVLAFLSISLFAGTFTYLKEMIPYLVPYTWDPLFADMDWVVHGGNEPWELLLPLFGAPLMTTALNAAYHFWFFLFYFLVFVACFDKSNAQRSMVFLVAFVLIWVIGGNLVATLLSSGGPVYYEALGYGDRFVPLVDRLVASNEISPVWALGVHEMLLDGYLNDGPVKGISAMPSMHVGSSMIMALYGFTIRKWIGWALLGFTLIIQIGSVHLAWHYAIDGYLAVLIALVCWRVSRLLVERFGPQT